MDSVTAMNMAARNSCYREGYVNYGDKVDQPLDRSASPGDLDAWFYSQVPLSRIGAPDDDLKNYNRVGKKRITNGSLVMTYSPFGTISEADAGAITEDVPEQMCAKRCTANACTGFTYDKNYSRGTCYIYRGELKTNDCDSCSTYTRRVPEPIPDRRPAPAPAAPPGPRPLIEVTVYEGENFTRGSTTMKFYESDFKKTLLGMVGAAVNWPGRREVNSFMVEANASATWIVSFPSREKSFPFIAFSGKRGFGNLQGGGGYHGSMVVLKR